MPKTKPELKRIEWFDDRCYRIRYENLKKEEIEEYLPSVTTVLNVSPKPFLLKWYADLGYREARLRMFEAAERGSRIHWAWETYCSGGVVIYHPIKTPIYDDTEIEEIKKKYGGHYFMLRDQGEMWDFMKLAEAHKRLKPTFKLNEQTVFNLTTKEAGTADNLFKITEGEYEINGAKPVKLSGYYVVDVKTGAAVGDEAKMQITAYAQCLTFMHKNNFIDLPDDFSISGGLILHTSSQTKKGIAGLSSILVDIDEMHTLYSRYRNLYDVWSDTNPNFAPIMRQLPGYEALQENENANEEKEKKTVKTESSTDKAKTDNP